MSPVIKILFILLFSFSFELELEENKIYEVSEFFAKMKKAEITEEDAKSLVDSLKNILERYVFLDILKNPPQPSDNYYNIVDLIDELDKVSTEKRSLYEFYRNIKAILSKCQDLHLDITLEKELGDNIKLKNTIYAFPVIFLFSNNDGEIHAIPNPMFPRESFDEDIYNIISQNMIAGVTSINGLEPNDYIQNFNGLFKKLKDSNAQYTLNLNMIPYNMLNAIPLDIDDLTNIVIEYSTGISINLDYKIIYNDDTSILLNQYFDLHINNFNKSFNYLELLKPNPALHNYHRISNKNLKAVTWDKTFTNGIIKCKVDSENQVNIIVQTSFNIEDESQIQDFINLLGGCFDNFYENDYPIIIIENMNAGGIVILADIFKEYLNLNHPNFNYMSFKYNNDVKNYFAKYLQVKDTKTCEFKRGDYIFNSDSINDDYGEDNNNQKIIHKRTKIFDYSLINENTFYNLRKTIKNIRKPHEIIIFTDGFSYSATSIFIKGIQLNGGAIIVGYAGNPKSTNKFDASQSPSAVFTEGNAAADDLIFKKIKSLGFSLTITIMETFSHLDNNYEKNIPLEYQINLVDERVPLYNGYDIQADSNYQDFINMAKSIFEKYKTKCNPENKNLLFITKACTFTDSRMHGGYECDDEGNWSTKCVPSFCDNGYYLDKRSNKCIENICVDKPKEEKEKSKVFLIVAIVFGALFLVVIIIFIIATIVGGFERKNYLIIPIVIFLILFAVFLILYLTKE